jgi:hypothetical protein
MDRATCAIDAAMSGRRRRGFGIERAVGCGADKGTAIRRRHRSGARALRLCVQQSNAAASAAFNAAIYAARGVFSGAGGLAGALARALLGLRGALLCARRHLVDAARVSAAADAAGERSARGAANPANGAAKTSCRSPG